jgi:alkylation response protein AidB-like acyl-CoA dehydrogenase
MDIEFTDEQSLLQESVQKMLRDRYDFAARQKIAHSEEGWSRKRWEEFAELGLLAAPFSEAVGGLGQGPLATLIIMEEFGRRLVVEPFFETIVIAGGLLEEAGSEAQKQHYIPDIMSGMAIWTLAASESKSRYDLNIVATRAEQRGDAFVLHGAKSAVMAAPWADKLIVSARTSGEEGDPSGISLFIVDRQSPNLHLQSFKTLDGRRAAEIVFEGVSVPAENLLGTESQGLELLERCRDRAIAALGAEAVGAMSELNEVTLEYSKTRKQFGIPIGSFQVLQHRMADMFIAQQEATAITYLLNVSLMHEESGQSQLASAVKAKVGEAARFIGEQAIQIHGGMGMTDELSAGHYFKRLSAINILFGDATYHLLKYAKASEAA